MEAVRGGSAGRLSGLQGAPTTQSTPWGGHVILGYMFVLGIVGTD